LLLYYITDRNQFPGNAEEKQLRLLAKIAECAMAGVDFIQLREKREQENALSIRELEVLASKAVAAIPDGSATKLLVSSRIDVALASGAHGVHLPANDLSATQAREIFDRAGAGKTVSQADAAVRANLGAAKSIIGVSAHSLNEVVAAEKQRADFVVFAPVFEKNGTANPRGLAALREICGRSQPGAQQVPVLALGGVNLQNARLCLDAGAAGIAAIRMFQEGDVQQVVRRLRDS